MQGATNGDFTHGLIHPEQMIGGRLLMPGSAHATPIPGLYLCGASCHPGPGVTFLPVCIQWGQPFCIQWGEPLK